MAAHRKARPSSITRTHLQQVDQLLMSFDDKYRAAQAFVTAAGLKTINRDREEREGDIDAHQTSKKWPGTNKYHMLSHVTSDILNFGSPSECLSHLSVSCSVLYPAHLVEHYHSNFYEAQHTATKTLYRRTSKKKGTVNAEMVRLLHCTLDCTISGLQSMQCCRSSASGCLRTCKSATWQTPTRRVTQPMPGQPVTRSQRLRVHQSRCSWGRYIRDTICTGCTWQRYRQR